jgi:hypothetical protein
MAEAIGTLLPHLCVFLVSDSVVALSDRHDPMAFDQ